MKNKKFIYPLVLACVCFLLFCIETVLVCTFDVQAIGPLDSSVGFATVNQKTLSFIAEKIGNQSLWYNVSEFLGVASILTAISFAVFGAYRLIKTKKLSGVGNSVLAFGAVLILTAIFYVIFELVVINYRPILVDGELEASFPSSHTLLAVSVLGCAAEYFFESKMKSVLRFTFYTLFNVILIVLVCARLFSGVHWFTDIVAGITLGLSLVFTYSALIQIDLASVLKKK